MKNETILIAGAVAAVAALAYAKRGAAAIASNTAMSGDGKRLQGVADLYSVHGAQQDNSAAAITARWDEMRSGVFKDQPDFYV
jgi:hypothetical protein